MSLVRPEAARRLRQWREPLSAALAMAAGLWLIWLGGFVLMPVGALILLVALGWLVVALRRQRFLRTAQAPGVVEVDEGQVGYYGPSFGGFVALSELAELRLVDLHGQRHWRLRTLGGEALMIPVDAAGADRLYDAFAALEGIDMARVSAALDRAPSMAPLWRRDRTLAAQPR